MSKHFLPHCDCVRPNICAHTLSVFSTPYNKWLPPHTNSIHREFSHSTNCIIWLLFGTKVTAHRERESWSNQLSGKGKQTEFCVHQIRSLWVSKTVKYLNYYCRKVYKLADERTYIYFHIAQSSITTTTAFNQNALSHFSHFLLYTRATLFLSLKGSSDEQKKCRCNKTLAL